jgi:8-oxo-dGTP diphosphatase
LTLGDSTLRVDPAVPRIGVAVLVLRDGLVLLGKRAGSHGAGTWAVPGGHLEFGESIERCAIREVAEETGLSIRSVDYGPYTNDVFASEGKHYVTLFVTADCPTGDPALLEPGKCSSWQWFQWEQLPEPLFAPLAELVRTGFVPHHAP